MTEDCAPVPLQRLVLRVAEVSVLSWPTLYICMHEKEAVGAIKRSYRAANNLVAGH